MAFEDLADLSAGRTLELPINGRTYVIEDVDGETGLWAQQLLELGAAAHAGKTVDGSVLDDDQESKAYERILGPALAEMLADRVMWDQIKHVFYTTLIWITIDKENAEKHWATYGQEAAEGEEEPRPNRGSRRASAAVARTTKSPARGSGTRASKTPVKRARPSATSSKPGPS